MKKIISFFVLLLLFSSISYSQQVIDYKNNWGINGFSLNSQRSSGVEVNFSVHKLYLDDVVVDGVTLKTAKMEGIFLPNEAGKPDVAGTGRLIAVPQGATATYRIISYRTEVIKNINIAPAPVLPLDNDKNPLKYIKDNAVYSRNANYPESPVSLSRPMKMRGVDAVMLGISPFLYNPVTKELTVYYDLKVEVSFIGGNGHFGDDTYRNRWWEPMLSDHLLNYNSLPTIDFDHRYSNIMTENGYEYVIIVPNNAEFSQWADSIKNFRNAQGIKTGVYRLSDIGGNTVEGIKTWVTNAYNTWTIKPVAMCLLADYGTDASGASTITSKLQPHPAGIYPDFASDNYYADVNGDEMPEIVFSRIIANNATELQTLITKNLNYERNPPTSATFYDHPITALGWQTERWFQLCSELVGGYFKKVLNKHPVRINKVYQGTPGTVWSTATNTATVVNYFGTIGRGYIPMTPDSLGGFDGGTPTQVVNALNSGSFLLQHRDHGEYIGWGEPGFNTNYIPQLTNTDLTFVYSINCETGAYHNPSGCPANGSFVEVFYRYKYNNQNAGALGMVCPSEVSYSFVNDTYVWGMYDNMWPSFLPDYGNPNIGERGLKPAFGMASGKYFLQSSSWPYNPEDKLVTYRLFHMHGDAFLNLYSEVPQNLTVNHSSAITAGVNQFTVTANAGSLIALSINGNILGTATGTGSPVNITMPGTQVPGQVMSVVVTKQNYYRYTGSVNVVPASGPYVIYDSLAINDAAPLGNGNHLMDYAETNQLSIRVKNVGVSNSTNTVVKVRTTDPYITLNDSTESYGTVNANGTLTITNGFSYNVANSIPDGRLVNFALVVTNGTDTWNSNFNILAHAPVLKMGGYTVTDSAGNNNGRIDPGETGKLNIAVKNSGSSMANNVAAKIISSSSSLVVNVDSAVYGSVNANDSLRRPFTVTAAPGVVVGTQIMMFSKVYSAQGTVKIDTFYVTVGLPPVLVYHRNSLGKNIPDNNTAGITDTIMVNISNLDSWGKVVDLNVVIDTVTHTYDGDLSFQISHNGTIVSLIAARGSSGDNFFGTTLNDSAANPISAGTAPFTGSFKPESVLSAFNNMNANGAWVLRIWDAASSDVGVLKAWSIVITIQLVTGEITQVQIPNKFSLNQNYPNPFNPTTKISYSIPKDGFVKITLYDVLGKEITKLVSENKKAGLYNVDFDGSKLASGVYFYKLESGSFSDIKRMMLIK